MLAKMKNRKRLCIREVYCCGCFFDKLYYIFNTKDLIEFENFEEDFIEVKGYLKNFFFGIVVIVCDDILSLVMEKKEMKYNFYICRVFKESKLLYGFKLSK